MACQAEYLADTAIHIFDSLRGDEAAASRLLVA
jgi:hypothetical protein